MQDESEGEIKRYGIVVNVETLECVVELYFRPVRLFALPNAKLLDF
jgi:hypothetical protein